METILRENKIEVSACTCSRALIKRVKSALFSNLVYMVNAAFTMSIYSEANKLDPPEAGSGVGCLKDRDCQCQCVRAFGQMSSTCYVEDEFGDILCVVAWAPQVKKFRQEHVKSHFVFSQSFMQNMTNLFLFASQIN
jgi:hypothetical protein